MSVFGILSIVISIVFFGLCLGAVLGIVIFVPLTIYGIPYSIWVGGQNCAGRYKELKNESFFRTVRNATILYKSWITRKEPRF